MVQCRKKNIKIGITMFPIVLKIFIGNPVCGKLKKLERFSINNNN